MQAFSWKMIIWLREVDLRDVDLTGHKLGE